MPDKILDISAPRLLIAGGGTGGHLLAGVAVAEKWSAPVLFVGSYGRIEEKIIPKTPYPLKLLKIGSFNRVSWGRRIKTLVQLPVAFITSGWILWRWKPDFVLGVGGYSSGPVVMTAWLMKVLRLLKVHVAVLEQNSIPGMTNRILARFSDQIFTAFPQMEKFFPKKPVLQTGNPIRSAMKRMPSAPRDPFQIFIFGGSGGAVGMNSVVLAALPFLQDLQNGLRWVHQTGEIDYQRVSDAYRAAGIAARVEKFIDDMPAVYQASSLLICRAGSSTLSEVAAVGRAAVLIPLPTAADNHQELNARVYEHKGAAICLRQGETTGESLAAIIRNLVLNQERLNVMEEAATQFYFPNAAENIVRSLKV